MSSRKMVTGRQPTADDRAVFRSREALWHAEVFALFLDWVSAILANAVPASISGMPNSMTWALFVLPDKAEIFNTHLESVEEIMKDYRAF